MSKLASLLVCSFLLFQGAGAQVLDSAQPRKVVPVAPVLENTPLDSAVLESSITKGVDFLLRTQNSDGSWGNATRTKGLNIYAPMPGAHHAFRMGTTSLALAGVIAANDKRSEVNAAIERCEAWMLREMPKLRRA